MFTLATALLGGALIASTLPTAALSTPDPTAEAPFADPGTYFVPPMPGVTIEPSELAAHRSTYAAPRRTLAMEPLAYDKAIGDHTSITVLAEFSDIPHSTYGQTFYDDQLNYNGSSRVSARTWFYENSLGNYTVYSTVTTWVTLPQTQAYYDSNTGQMIADAARAADAQVNFGGFDDNGDGWVDNLVVLHSGGDQAAGCAPNCIWSHSSVIYGPVLDGKRIGPYATVADFGHPRGDALGVWIHEFGHLALDLPDLYDVYYNNDGVGVWDMMAGGSWYLNHYTAWSKEYLGWIEPFEPVFNVDGYTIYPPTDTARYNPVKVTTNYTNEYFLLEMRWDGAARYDTGVPYNGLLILHVDSNVVANTWERGSNTVEANTNHKGIDVEEVGAQDLDSTSGGGTYSNDIWVGNPTGFTPTSTPNSNLYVNGGNYATGIRIYNISTVLTAGGPHMTFSIDTGRVNFGLSGRVLGSPERQALPGTSVTYPIEFSTFSVAGDAVTLSVEGVNQSLGGLDRSALTLPPLGSATANLTVTVPLGWSAADPAWVQVRATSTAQPTNNFLVPTVTRAAQFYGVAFSGALNFTATPGDLYLPEIVVWNEGNGPDNVSVSPTFDPSLILVSVLAQPGIIARGASTAVPLALTVPTTVLNGTRIPLELDIRTGPKGSEAHLKFFANITAGKYAQLALDVQAVGPYSLDPDVPRSVNLTVHNQGNYPATYLFTATGPVGVTVLYTSPLLLVAPFSDGAVEVFLRAGHDTPAWSMGDVWFVATLDDGLGAASNSLTVRITQRFEVSLSGEASFAAPPGGSVLLNLLAFNFGNGPDNATLSIAPAFSDWNASLSASDLALDTTVSGRSQEFQLGAKVPPRAAGNLLMLFTVTLRSQDPGVSVTLPVNILVLPVYAFVAAADAAQGPMTSTETATFLINVRNNGNVRDSYSLTVSDLPQGWTSEFVPGEVVTAGPLGVGQITLLVRPLAAAQADRYDFQIVAASEGNPSRPTVMASNITILSHREILIEATPLTADVKPGATLTLRLLVKNLGNVRENLFVQGIGPSFQSVSADPVQLSLPAYEERVVNVVVILKNNQAAGPASLVLTASALNNESVKSETSLEIQVAALPAPPPASLPGLEAGAAFAALAGAFVLAARRDPRRP
ncbi:MAG TPA: M6 family metalloprotease domain-containing protein [Candidatus Thermoplasmatota archaeon]|nr:M6 family metalloprotease domain-containing protein [Candidatus Thermoplasmatota archaeon]